MSAAVSRGGGLLQNILFTFCRIGAHRLTCALLARQRRAASLRLVAVPCGGGVSRRLTLDEPTSARSARGFLALIWRDLGVSRRGRARRLACTLNRSSKTSRMRIGSSRIAPSHYRQFLDAQQDFIVRRSGDGHARVCQRRILRCLRRSPRRRGWLDVPAAGRSDGGPGEAIGQSAAAFELLRTRKGKRWIAWDEFRSHGTIVGETGNPKRWP